jgi:hypothetical protein
MEKLRQTELNKMVKKKKVLKKLAGLGMVVHACIPSYLAGTDWKIICQA